MTNFREIAEPLAKMGVPMTPVRPGTKRAFLPDFPTTATTDLDQIYVWDAQYPDHNGACVARAEKGGVFFWEVDSADVLPRIKNDTGHDVLSEINTCRVRSRSGCGHFYFRHTPATIASLPNLSQTYVIGQDWSLRTNREYVVAPGSIHPDTGKLYEVLNPGTPIADAPQWLIDWLLTQKVQKHSAPQGASTPETVRNAAGHIPHGSIHGWMLTQAGKLRQQGLTQDEIEPILLRLTHENCEPPIDDAKVAQMAKSICIYEPGRDTSLILNQTIPQPPSLVEPEEEIDFSEAEYPVFPKWVMQGTSIYEGFVKPYCAKNSRIDYFMWMPTAAMMMNYLGTKVKVPFKSWKPSFYLVFIGEKGRAHKSSSIKDGMKFLEYASVLRMYTKEEKAAEGASLVWEVGSPEGLGTDMQRTNCKNAILFYDELSSLVSKAGIEGSGMSGALLKMYESNAFANSIKNKKDTFSLAPNDYVTTLITATTDKRFLDLWGKFSGSDTGMKDRFTFIYQPKELPDEKLEEVAPYQEAALATKKLIDKAISQGTYKFFDQTPFLEMIKIKEKDGESKYNGRQEIRAEKWALYFAIDLGLGEIDEDCVERGIAISRYEHEVKEYLKTYEAQTFQASIQIKIMRMVKQRGDEGSIRYQDLEKLLHGVATYGTDVWNKSINGLVVSGYLAMAGTGRKGSPLTVNMLRDLKFSDE